MDVYLDSKDPMNRAKRVMARKASENDSNAPVTGHVQEAQAAISATRRHQVQLRDKGQCAHVDVRGERCVSKRWLDVHHVLPRS